MFPIFQVLWGSVRIWSFRPQNVTSYSGPCSAIFAGLLHTPNTCDTQRFHLGIHLAHSFSDMNVSAMTWNKHIFKSYFNLNLEIWKMKTSSVWCIYIYIYWKTYQRTMENIETGQRKPWVHFIYFHIVLDMKFVEPCSFNIVRLQNSWPTLFRWTVQNLCFLQVQDRKSGIGSMEQQHQSIR